MSQLFTSGHQSIGDSASASNEHSGLISFKIDWFDLLAVQGTLKSLLQHHNSEASIFQHSAFFMVELPHLYMTTGKTTLLLLFSHSVVSDSVTPWTAACRASLSFSSFPCSSPGVCSSLCPFSWWCHPTISSFSFSLCPQSFPASGSFPMSQLFASGDQIIGASASASVFPMNVQVSFPLGLTGLILLQFKELSRVFSSTTIQKHQFFGTQPSFWSNSHICT